MIGVSALLVALLVASIGVGALLMWQHLRLRDALDRVRFYRAEGTERDHEIGRLRSLIGSPTLSGHTIASHLQYIDGQIRELGQRQQDQWDKVRDIRDQVADHGGSIRNLVRTTTQHAAEIQRLENQQGLEPLRSGGAS